MRETVNTNAVSCRRDQTITKREHKTKLSAVETLVSEDRDLMKALLRETLQEVLEAQMTEFLGGGPGRAQRQPQRLPGRLLQPQPGDPHRQA